MYMPLGRKSQAKLAVMQWSSHQYHRLVTDTEESSQWLKITLFFIFFSSQLIECILCPFSSHLDRHT
jgi:hypothetical protein